LPFNYILKLEKILNLVCATSPTSKCLVKKIKKVADHSSFIWDYQFKLSRLCLNIKIISPIYHSVENEGFNDARSTNTKTKKPWWMRSKLDKINHNIVGMDSSSFAGVFLRITEENTIFGTSLIFRLEARMKKSICCHL
jgi:hypothetical protein